jgi:hypothetical protein
VILKSNLFVAAALIFTLAASPAIALGRCVGCDHANGGGKGGQGAPGPIAGAGLGYLVLAGAGSGAYYLYRRWRKRNPRD